MRNLKFLILFLFIGALNLSVISCWETNDNEHDDMDDMEVHDEEMMEDEGMNHN